MPSTPPSDLDPHGAKQRAFRKALGSFATGVTIVTTMGHTDEPIGVTASSFNSVSLDPPLILWSLAKSSLSYQAFSESGHFAVHVLAENQSELSSRFAQSKSNKWDGLDWHAGQLGSPLLGEFLALFECRTHAQYDGGDHVIMLGEVVNFELRDHAPLLFHSGAYAGKRPI
ncbi:MAG: flavin reductase family protein [Marinomonas sp.]